MGARQRRAYGRERGGTGAREQHPGKPPSSKRTGRAGDAAGAADPGPLTIRRD